MSDIELSVLEAQQKIHELIAQQHPLEQTLNAIADWVSSMMPGALVSIMRFHPGTNSLSLMPSGRFSDDYFQAMQNIRCLTTWGPVARRPLPRNWLLPTTFKRTPAGTVSTTSPRQREFKPVGLCRF
jgi:hypothetical protein